MDIDLDFAREVVRAEAKTKTEGKETTEETTSPAQDEAELYRTLLLEFAFDVKPEVRSTILASVPSKEKADASVINLIRGRCADVLGSAALEDTSTQAKVLRALKNAAPSLTLTVSDLTELVIGVDREARQKIRDQNEQASEHKTGGIYGIAGRFARYSSVTSKIAKMAFKGGEIDPSKYYEVVSAAGLDIESIRIESDGKLENTDANKNKINRWNAIITADRAKVDAAQKALDDLMKKAVAAAAKAAVGLTMGGAPLILQVAVGFVQPILVDEIARALAEGGFSMKNILEGLDKGTLVLSEAQQKAFKALLIEDFSMALGWVRDRFGAILPNNVVPSSVAESVHERLSDVTAYFQTLFEGVGGPAALATLEELSKNEAKKTIEGLQKGVSDGVKRTLFAAIDPKSMIHGYNHMKSGVAESLENIKEEAKEGATKLLIEGLKENLKKSVEKYLGVEEKEDEKKKEAEEKKKGPGSVFELLMGQNLEQLEGKAKKKKEKAEWLEENKNTTFGDLSHDALSILGLEDGFSLSSIAEEKKGELIDAAKVKAAEVAVESFVQVVKPLVDGKSSLPDEVMAILEEVQTNAKSLSKTGERYTPSMSVLMKKASEILKGEGKDYIKSAKKGAAKKKLLQKLQIALENSFADA